MKKMVVKASSSNPTKLRVKFEPYDRYESHPIKTATVSGETLLDALCKMVDRMALYITSEDIIDEGYTAQEVIDSIDSSNGDGCDFIILLENLTTGEVLMDWRDGYEEEEESWDD